MTEDTKDINEEKKDEIFIRTKSDGHFYKTSAGNLELASGDEVLFESEMGQDVGFIIPLEATHDLVEVGGKEEENKVAIIRKLSDKDRQEIADKEKEAAETLQVCEEKIKKHGLEMKLLSAELSFDSKKLTFYFTAPQRVDFRSLVPDLASTFKKLIRLQQVGARDKAKCYGTVGRCGQGVCCKRFLKGDLESVTIDMAAEQNLGQMGSNRVTGACGKLMCCLKYELDCYSQTKKKMPAIGSKVKTQDGEGVVISQNIVKNKIMVELKSDNKKVLEVDC